MQLEITEIFVSHSKGGQTTMIGQVDVYYYYYIV